VVIIRTRNDYVVERCTHSLQCMQDSRCCVTAVVLPAIADAFIRHQDGPLTINGEKRAACIMRIFALAKHPAHFDDDGCVLARGLARLASRLVLPRLCVFTAVVYIPV
jgi:hypothetical protein